jgi:DNA-binding CsgD family transcriptional regulator/tetratricopeptide (TPR) repeat protein
LPAAGTALHEGADPATVARLYDGFAYEASLLDHWQEAADARERALGLWREVGDRLREGDTLRWLAYSLCSLSRGGEGIAAAQAAIALLEPLGPTVELAWAYASLAAMWMVRRANADAIELARRAQAVAGPLGLTEVLSDALNSEACAVHATGGEWVGTLRRALDTALAGRHEAEVARAYVNLHSCSVADRDWAVAERYFTEGAAYCDDHDIATYSIFLRSERTAVLERTGRWDQAVAICAELLYKGGPSPNIRLCPLCRLGCPYEAGLALLGSADEASLREALWIFSDLGASAAVRFTRQKMRRLAIRSIPAGPRTATREHPLGLTRREHEVLDLICAGHTNAEIAGKLFISVKTVDRHVSAVLAKLGAPTRGAAATRAAKLGLVTTVS